MTDGVSLSHLHEVPYSNIKGAYVKVKQERIRGDPMDISTETKREKLTREGTIVGRANGTGLYYDAQRGESVVDRIGPCIYIETPEETVLEVSTEKSGNELLEYNQNPNTLEDNT
jgi:hypothetical protein